MEFSGYQEGLMRILREYDSMCDGRGGGSIKLRLVFINDTAFSSHFYPLSVFLIKLLLNFKIYENQNIMVGLKSYDRKCGLLNDKNFYYITTWAFSIQADIKILKCIKFYDNHETFSDFDSKILPGLADTYVNEVTSWLQPRGFLNGWYKAIPGIPLHELTLRRKRLAIYLEHMLIVRLASTGVHTIDIFNLISSCQYLTLKILKFIDRIYLNFSKINFRLRFLIINKLLKNESRV